MGRKLLTAFAGLLVLAFGFCTAGVAPNADRQAARAATVADSGLQYGESTQETVNPDRGFCQALGYSFSRNDDTAPWSVGQLKEYGKKYGLLHLRFGLAAFSDNGALKVESATQDGIAVKRVTQHGEDSELSAKMLAALQKTLDNLRDAGGTAIVRFSYNPNGLQATLRVENGKAINGYVPAEPAAGMSLIERHIEQLGEVLSRYADVVTAVETGMFGPWGEQHSTPSADAKNDENYYRLVEKWLSCLPQSRTVSVRRPLYFIHFANRKYDLHLREETLGEYKKELIAAHPALSRVGVYNDGYLGSASDLGTYSEKNRTAVSDFLSVQATSTLYGGEVVADAKTGGIGEYNNLENVEKEAFRTHTSYLNEAWNDKVIRAWKETPYAGKDARYQGQSGYTYVANHLGYRLVLRQSRLSAQTEQGGLLRLEGEIENVGFGNVVNEKKMQILLQSEDALYRAAVNFDVRAVQSTARYAFTMRLPSDIAANKYTVYCRLSDAEETLIDSPMRCIRFSNDDARIWNAELGANRLGEVQVSASDNPGNHTQFVQEHDKSVPSGGCGCGGNAAAAPLLSAGLALLFFSLRKV